MNPIPTTSEPKKRSLLPIVLALAVAAIVLSATALVMSLTASTAPAPTPVTREIRILIVPVEPHNISMAMMEEMHMYIPGTIVVHRGDTIRLTIVNMDEHRHGFEIQALGVETDQTLDIAPGDEVTLPQFVVTQAGIYEWKCNVPFVAETPTSEQECGEDHDEMRGHLIVE